MCTICLFAAVPFNIGWQEIVFAFLIVAVLAGPGMIALAFVLLVLRRERQKRRASPPIPAPQGDPR